MEDLKMRFYKRIDYPNNNYVKITLNHAKKQGYYKLKFNLNDKGVLGFNMNEHHKKLANLLIEYFKTLKDKQG
jgi:hypothetical protein